jgi:hypothetical protein
VKPRSEEETGALIRATQRFLRVTACRFAAMYGAAADAMLWMVLEGSTMRDDPAPLLRDHFDSAGDANLPAVVLFPELRHASEVVALLRWLATSERWLLSLRERRRHPHDDVLVGMEWMTAHGDRTSVMGLAPLGTMPATRRAPFVTLIAWTGQHVNPNTPPTRVDGEVGFVSMPPVPSTTPAIDGEKYDELWNSTRKAVSELRGYPLDGAARRDVGFSLPAEFKDELASMCTPHTA